MKNIEGINGTNTYLLREIYKEICLYDSKLTYESFFSEITSNLSEKDLKKYTKSASNWLKKNKKSDKKEDQYTDRINNKHLKENIANHLDFPSELWDQIDERIQEKEAKKYVTRYLDRRDNLLATLALPSDTQVKDKLTSEEYEKLNSLQSPADFKRFSYENPRPRETLLVALIHHAYKLGYYEHTMAHLLPQLKSRRTDIDMRFIEANILGSHQIHEYHQASLILEQIETEDNTLYIDLKTAMTSNYLRKSLSEDLDAKQRRDVIYKMSRNYKILFYSNTKHLYYPAINYAYMVAIADIAYPEVKEFRELNDKKIAELKSLCAKSIKKDKEDGNPTGKYYAIITEFEFRLLLGLDIVNELTLYLAESQPEVSLVDRSKRQMVFYRDEIVDCVDTSLVNRVIDGMEGYVEMMMSQE